MERHTSVDVTRVMLQVLAIGMLILSSVWVLRPFGVAFAWATTIVVSTWPLLLRLQRAAGDRRSAAVTIMTLILLFTVVLPLFYGVLTLVQNAYRVEGWTDALATMRLPMPPTWIETVPLVGGTVRERWNQLALATPAELSELLMP